jgi:hypothetical protein
MPIRIHGISVPPKPEMLDHMQATQRIRASKKFWRVGQTSQIGLDESDIRMPAPPHGPNIHDIKAAKGCNMGDKSVNSATDINMPNWICLMDQLGNEQILVEIVSTGGASVHAMFTEYGVQLANFTPKLQEPAPVTPDLSQVSGSSARRTGGLPKPHGLACSTQKLIYRAAYVHRLTVYLGGQRVILCIIGANDLAQSFGLSSAGCHD